MATATESNLLERWYENSIGRPATADEVYGYWLFAVGVAAGFVGLALVMVSSGPGESVRGLGIGLGALGLVLLLIGQTLRLPLKRAATMLAVGGAILGVLAVAWFAVAFNAGNWGSAFAHSESIIIGLYGLGILVIAAGSVLAPLVTSPRDEQEAAEVRAGQAEAERDAATAEIARQEEEASRQAAAADESDADTQALTEELAAAESRAGQAEAERDAAIAEIARQEEATAAAEQQALATDRQRIADSQSTFELYTDEGGKHRWRLRHDNDNIIADSSQGYASRQSAQQGLSAVKRDAFGASVLDLDKMEDTEDTEDTEDAAESEAAAVEEESQATFEIYDDSEGRPRWRLRHDNGNIIADGGQGYASADSRDDAVEGIRGYAQSADYLKLDPASFEVFRDAAGEYRWRLLHRNGSILADSGQGYASRQGATQGLDSVQRNATEGGNAEFEVYEDEGGEYRWRLLHRNGNIIADSSQGYASRSGAEEAVERIREYAPEAHVLDIGTAAFELYEDEGGEWRWRLRHRNGSIMADSSQGYASRGGAEDGLNSVKRNAPEADVEAVSES